MKSTVTIVLSTRWEVEHDSDEQLLLAKRAIMRDMESSGLGVITGFDIVAKKIQSSAQEIKP